MNSFNEEIKKRNELSKYLEHSFLNDAAETFLKNHSTISLDNILIDANCLKYSAFATRIWLNYLDNVQFEKILQKRLKSDNPFFNNKNNFTP